MKWLLAVAGMAAIFFPLAMIFAASDSWVEVAFWVVGVVSYLALPVAIAIAVLRYRLYDIDKIVSRTIGYLIVTVTLAAVFAGAILAFEAVLAPLTGGNTVAVAASTLVAAALFQPLRRRVQSVLDRRFNRAGYDAERTVAAFAAQLRDEVDLESLSADVDAGGRRDRRPGDRKPLDPTVGDRGVTAPAAPVGTRAATFAAAGLAVEISPTDPLFAHLQGASGVVDTERLQLDSRALVELRAAHVRVIVPLVAQGELIGALYLGPRLSDQGYSADDRTLLATLAAHAAPAIRVAQLVRAQAVEIQARERLEQEMRVAALIQQQFLPRELPRLPDWQVAALYGPARAVGGDFYDFIALPDGRIGIVVGDVTDKGVPAALIMARTQSVLRGEAPRLLSPAKVLERANEILLPEMPARMFVTCLYVVLEPETGRVVYANAGHNLPYVRTAEGVIELRATGMPLGLLPGMDYPEHEAVIAPGESVLLYSDGLVEAHDRDGEMFGFPRLRELMAAEHTGSDLLDHLLRELQRLRGERMGAGGRHHPRGAGAHRRPGRGRRRRRGASRAGARARAGPRPRVAPAEPRRRAGQRAPRDGRGRRGRRRARDRSRPARTAQDGRQRGGHERDRVRQPERPRDPLRGPRGR